MNEPSILRTVAGDDLTFAVEFSGAAVDFADGHRAELILHYPDGTDEPIVPVCQEGNVATFALTGAKTRELLKKNPMEAIFITCKKTRGALPPRSAALTMETQRWIQPLLKIFWSPQRPPLTRKRLKNSLPCWPLPAIRSPHP